MKIALTIWEGRISPVFDVCREAVVLEISGGHVVSTATVDLDTDDPFRKTDRLAELAVETLICGAISLVVHDAAEERGLHVICFVAGELGEVVEAFLQGTLPGPAYAMPGCCGERRRHRGSRPRSRGNGHRRGRLADE